MLKIWEWGGKKKNKAYKWKTEEYPKCHLRISQLKKGIYMLNIIVQNILKKRWCEGERSYKNTKTLIPLKGVLKLDGRENPKSNPKKN